VIELQPSFPDSKEVRPIVRRFWRYSAEALRFGRAELDHDYLHKTDYGPRQGPSGRNYWQKAQLILPRGSEEAYLEGSGRYRRRELAQRKEAYESLRSASRSLRQDAKRTKALSETIRRSAPCIKFRNPS